MMHLRGAARFLFSALSASAFLLPAVSAQTPGPRARLAALPARTEARVALPASLTARPRTAEFLSRLPGATELEGLSLVLTRTPEQEVELTQLLKEQQDPASPQYHHWLTPAQFGERFGVADGDLSLIREWLQGAGLVVRDVAPSRNRIAFSGTASAVEAAFGVTLQQYRRNGIYFHENSDAVQLPVSLAAVVAGISGLSSYHVSSFAVLGKPLPQATASPQYNLGTSAHYLVPWDFRQIFGMNALIGAGNDGTGVGIGVIGQSAVDPNQLTYFQGKTGQTPKLPTMVLVPGTGLSNLVRGDEGESELDLEYSSGSAPGATVKFIYTGCGAATSGTVLAAGTDCNNDGIFTAMAYAITGNLAPILTLSYGGCEADFVDYATTTMEPILKQANAQGQTILVSSGDTGAATCDQGSKTPAVAQMGLTVSYPASSAYVTAVGGTQLSDSSQWAATNNSYGGSATGYILEYAWNDTSLYGRLAASGGGVSKLFPKPDWQIGSNVPADGHRDVPDVAFPASILHTPYLVCSGDAPCQSGSGFGGGAGSGGGGPVGGTSVSAPNFAAMLAVVEQANGGGALGNINPKLYAIAEESAPTTVFHDVGSGNNVVPCVVGTVDCPSSGTYGYTTTGGYDLVTGLGSIDASALAAALSAKSVQMQLVSSMGTAPVYRQPVTFTATLVGRSPEPTGTVTFSLNGTALGTPAALVNGVASYTYSGFTQLAVGTVRAAYSGDSTYDAASSMLTVEPVSVPATVSVSVAPASPAVNSSTVLTASVSGAYGTPTGAVVFSVDGVMLTSVPAAPVLSNGTVTTTYKFTAAGLHVVSARYLSAGDFYNLQAQPAGTPYPYGPYEGGTGSVNAQVTSPTQTLTPVLSVQSPPISPFAPTATVSMLLLLSTPVSAPVPSGSYSYSVDGGPQELLTTPSPSLVSLGVQPATAWTAGNHTVRVFYNGDNNYLPSAPINVTFNVVLPAFTLTTSADTLTIPSGSSGSLNLTVNSGVTYSGSTGFKLAILQTTGATFSGCYRLSSSNVFSSPGVPASTMLTMVSGTAGCTGAAAIAAPVASSSPLSLPHATWMVVSAGLLGGLLFRRRVRPVALFLVAMSVLLLGTAGCGGGSASAAGSSGTGTGTGTSPGGTTPIGTYVIQVTGTGSSYPGAVATTTFTLVVQ